MMHKILAVLVAAVIASGIAYAGSVNYTSSGTAGFRTTTDGTTNCVGSTACNLSQVTIWDQASGGFGWTITSGGAGLVDVATTGNNLYAALTSPIAAQSGAGVDIGAVELTPTTATGGLTTFFVQPASSTNATSVKASTGQVYWVLVMSNSATVNYLRFYNTAGTPACGSATGLVTQIQIPAQTSVGGVNIALPYGMPFSTGIGFCLTGGYGTTDITPATASAMSLTIGYK